MYYQRINRDPFIDVVLLGSTVVQAGTTTAIDYLYVLHSHFQSWSNSLIKLLGQVKHIHSRILEHNQITSTMKTLVLLSSLVALSIQQQAPLPNYMLGEFQLETSQGFEDFMYEIGVNWFTRKVIIQK